MAVQATTAQVTVNEAANGVNGAAEQNGRTKIPLPKRPSLGSRLSSVRSALVKALSPPPKVVYEPANDNTDPAANPATATGLLDDIPKLGFKDYDTLLMFLNAAVKGVEDDNTLLLERLIQFLAKLPPTSVAGRELTDGFINQLWDGLNHPPVTTLGEKYRYRQADGSGNNIHDPRLGAANTPYARSSQPMVFQRPDQPDAGLVFDLLMDRGDKFEPHPAKISSMLFYLASIIIHDLFQTDPNDYNNNLTSSYIDLSPLYGRNLDEQKAMRTFKDGLLKSDCFSSKRILGFPPGCGVFLIMFNRYHNYVVTQLAIINEGNRFPKPASTLTGTDAEAAWAKYDNDLFQTGRLITCGLYANIILKDYVRTILSLNRTGSTWDLDPRAQEGKNIFSKPVPEAVGNQVSAEFNLIYRWHSAISQRDEAWTEAQFRALLHDSDPSEAPVGQVLGALKAWEDGLSDEPEKRPFAGLTRGADGAFEDDKLVPILQAGIEDIAGSFGANRVPRCMRTIEILSIMQARYWNVATLNEFRAFAGLTKHTTFSDINPDPEVCKRLQQLYDAPDSVEFYPGLVAEKAKAPMSPGSGLCVNYTTSRAILSDAVALVRGDRFYTVDYDPKNITNWGYNESNYDLAIDQGQVLYKLILRAFPLHFTQNSIYAHFPLVIPSENKAILAKLGTADSYSWDVPAPQQDIILVKSYKAVSTILANQTDFKVTWGSTIRWLTVQPPPIGDVAGPFCLAGDNPANTASRKHIQKAFYPDGWTADVGNFYAETTRALLAQYSADLGGPAGSATRRTREIDIVRDVGNLANTRFMAAVFALPVKSAAHPRGFFTEQDLYLAFLVVFSAIFFDMDVARSFGLRQQARDVAQQLGQLVLAESEIFSALGEVEKVAGEVAAAVEAGKGRRGKNGKGTTATVTVTVTENGETNGVASNGSSAEAKLNKYGSHMVLRMLEKGKSVATVVWESIMPLVTAGVANQSQLVAQVIDYYLGDGVAHLPELYRLAHENTPEADDKLMRYMLEASRLRATVALWRDLATAQTITDYDPSQPDPAADASQLNPVAADPATAPTRTLNLPAGTRILCDTVTANHDGAQFPEPETIRFDRPLDAYLHYGHGPHYCLGVEASRVALTQLFKAVVGLKGLRRAPGTRGTLKSFPAVAWRGQVGRDGGPEGKGDGWTGLRAWMSADQSQIFPVPSTMRVRWDAE